jgi:hypothetical protein
MEESLHKVKEWIRLTQYGVDRIEKAWYFSTL